MSSLGSTIWRFLLLLLCFCAGCSDGRALPTCEGVQPTGEEVITYRQLDRLCEAMIVRSRAIQEELSENRRLAEKMETELDPHELLRNHRMRQEAFDVLCEVHRALQLQSTCINAESARLMENLRSPAAYKGAGDRK